MVFDGTLVSFNELKRLGGIHVLYSILSSGTEDPDAVLKLLHHFVGRGTGRVLFVRCMSPTLPLPPFYYPLRSSVALPLELVPVIEPMSLPPSFRVPFGSVGYYERPY